MTIPQSIPAHVAPRFGGAYGRRAESVSHTPRQNRLLAALPPASYEHLLPHLEPVALPAGWTIFRAGEREDHLYFPTSGIVSRFYLTQSGASTGFAITGNEGVVGIATFLGGGSMLAESRVMSAGYAYRLKMEGLNSDLMRDRPLASLLLRFAQALISQTGQIAACNRHHSLEQQLCLRLLLCLDRQPSNNNLTMTQDMLAQMLGVRRESITEAAGTLQDDRVIQYSRGHIAVLDRARLEAAACECYAVIAREYARMLPKTDEPRPLPLSGNTSLPGFALAHAF